MAKRGVGYTPETNIAVWVGKEGVLDSVPINSSVRLLNELDLQGEKFEKRYGHPSDFGSAQGFDNEIVGNNDKALKNWYKDQSAAHKEEWDGVPLPEEIYDLAFTQSQTGSQFYQKYWWAFEEGGTPETAVIVNEQTWSKHAAKWPRGVKLGLQSKPGPIDVYRKWYNVLWKPASVPDPSPPPEKGTEVEYYQKTAGKLVPGVVRSVNLTKEKIKFTPPGGGESTEYSLDDIDRLWRLKEGTKPPAPTPTPTSKPEPQPTPIPEPKPQKPSIDLKTAPPWKILEEFKKAVLSTDFGEGLNEVRDHLFNSSKQWNEFGPQMLKEIRELKRKK